MKDHYPKPPGFARKIFHWYCSDPLKEEIAGDLEERFLDHFEAHGLARARRNYWLNVLKFFRWHTLKRRRSKSYSQTQVVMIHNYLKIAFRSAIKNKAYSLINVSGLVLGLVSFILIMLYARHHLNYDKFHQNADQIYRVSMAQYAITPNALAPLVEENFPDELAGAVRGLIAPSTAFKLGNHTFTGNALLVDEGFLEMFSFEVLIGDSTKALSDQNALVLTRSEAIKHFNRIDVIGESITVQGALHQVSAVIADVPENSSLKFDYLIPLMSKTSSRKPVWNNASYFTFFQLTPGVDPEKFQTKYNGIVNEVNGDDPGVEIYQLHPMASVHLQLDGKLRYEMLSVTEGKYIYIFGGVAIFILLIAGVNYVNLATSRSIERAREVGIRKVTGALRGQLIRQFLGESSLFIFGSLAIAVGLTILVLPSFNQLAGVTLSVEMLLESSTLLLLVGIGLLVSLLAGIYPALALSRFQPVQVLKGNFSRSRQGSHLRKILVVFQFVISAFLLMVTLTIDHQFNFMMDKDIGLRKDQVLIIDLPKELRTGFEAFKSLLLTNPNILGAAPTNNNPLAVGASHAFRKKSEDDYETIHYLSSDQDFVEVMEMELLSGVGFDEVMVPFNQEKPSYILNETAVKRLGLTWDTAVGETVDIVGHVAPIQAVVKDFHFAPMSQEISPLVILNDPKRYYRSVIKIRPQNIARTLDFIEIRLNAVAPDAIFKYRFLDEAFESMYAKTSRLKLIFKLFSNLAIIIACLGMFALISFMAQNRAKEVGVRKVLGASEMNIFALLSSDFIKLVAISLLIALPVGYLAMNEWLDAYAYRVEMGIGLFVVVIAAALAVTFFTISFQAIKTARLNPAKILRSE